MQSFGYYSKPVINKLILRNESKIEDIIQKIKAGEINSKEQLNTLQETYYKKPNFEEFKDQQIQKKDHSYFRSQLIHQNRYFKQVNKILKQNKKEIENAIVQGQPLLFDSLPFNYDEAVQDELLPYNLEDSGIDGFRKFYKEYKSMWTLFSKQIASKDNGLQWLKDALKMINDTSKYENLLYTAFCKGRKPPTKFSDKDLKILEKVLDETIKLKKEQELLAKQQRLQQERLLKQQFPFNFLNEKNESLKKNDNDQFNNQIQQLNVSSQKNDSQNKNTNLNWKEIMKENIENSLTNNQKKFPNIKITSQNLNDFMIDQEKSTRNIKNQLKQNSNNISNMKSDYYKNSPRETQYLENRTRIQQQNQIHLLELEQNRQLSLILKDFDRSNQIFQLNNKFQRRKVFIQGRYQGYQDQEELRRKYLTLRDIEEKNQLRRNNILENRFSKDVRIDKSITQMNFKLKNQEKTSSKNRIIDLINFRRQQSYGLYSALAPIESSQAIKKCLSPDIEASNTLTKSLDSNCSIQSLVLVEQNNARTMLNHLERQCKESPKSLLQKYQQVSQSYNFTTQSSFNHKNQTPLQLSLDGNKFLISDKFSTSKIQAKYRQNLLKNEHKLKIIQIDTLKGPFKNEEEFLDSVCAIKNQLVKTGYSLLNSQINSEDQTISHESQNSKPKILAKNHASALSQPLNHEKLMLQTRANLKEIEVSDCEYENELN